MLNEYIWKLYLQSGGDEIVKVFSHGLSCPISEKYSERVKQLHKVYGDDNISDDIHEQLVDLAKVQRDNRSSAQVRSFFVEGTADVNEAYERIDYRSY